MNTQEEDNINQQQHNDAQAALALLRHEVEQRLGHAVRKPKDFAMLKEQIMSSSDDKISESTLKRIWGYVPSSSMPRPFTLSVLARFVGYESWERFLEAKGFAASEEPASHRPQAPAGSAYPAPVHDGAATQSTAGSSGGAGVPAASAPQAAASQADSLALRKVKFYRALVVAAVIALLGVVVAFVVVARQWHGQDQVAAQADASASRKLVTGMTFNDPHSYLRLLGIEPREPLWDKHVPSLSNTVVFTVTFHHPLWHNKGDASQYYPTLTTFKGTEPGARTQSALEMDSLINRSRYFQMVLQHPVVVLFMYNLNHNKRYTFLGVYRLNKSLSDEQHLVWDRIAREVDLDNLALLEHLPATS